MKTIFKPNRSYQTRLTPKVKRHSNKTSTNKNISKN